MGLLSINLPNMVIALSVLGENLNLPTLHGYFPKSKDIELQDAVGYHRLA